MPPLVASTLIPNSLILQSIAEMSALTDKVLAFSEVQGYDMDEVVDWAIDMLALGYETPNLLMLSSFTKPVNYLEITRYLEKACQELRLEFRIGEAGILSYSSFFIKQLAQGKQVKTNLSEIYKFYQEKDYAECIYDFYLLYWAWDDFDYLDTYSAYWPTATPKNIENLVVNTAKTWLSMNQF
jgi:hypothetical protein